MEAYLLEWLNLTLKWIHLIVGIAWIGTSFYFNWLEGNLERGKSSLEKGVTGDLWAVHGGGFYHVEKFEVAPEQLPSLLHWFKWEAYMTFITGFFLLIITFYLSPALFLIKPNLSELSPGLAVFISLISLAISWMVYDQLCKTKLVQNNFVFFWIVFLLLTLEAYGLTQVFNAKAAFIQTGAIIGTIMVANVFFVIIPSQKKMVKAMETGQVPDGAEGLKGYQRSFHNNYFTLPVLFIMISGHYPMTFGSDYNWLILAALALIGVLVRHYFNLKNKGRVHHWILPTAAVLMFLLAYISYPKPIQPQTSTACVGNVQVQKLIQTHCVACHATHPTNTAFAMAPKGIVFDNLSDIKRQANQIYLQTVTTHAMPLGNMTHMTVAERNQLANWYLNNKNGTKNGKPLCK